MLLKLSHRQFVFTLPKLRWVYFRHDRNLFEDVSRIIFSIIQDFYNESAPMTLKTASLVSYQSFGDLLRWNPHYHCIVLEGGIDETGSFHHIPIKNAASLTEVFRRRVIKLFVNSGLLERRFALKILSWKHSGFSVDASVCIPASSKKTRVNLSQYIIRHPVLLQKILYVRSNATVVYKTKYNEYFKKNIKLFSAADFIADLTMHIPPKHKHLIRYYGLYSSRTKGKAVKDGSLAKYGYKVRPKKTTDKLPDIKIQSVTIKAARRSWARLIQKVYEVNKILECLKRNNTTPFDKCILKAS